MSNYVDYDNAVELFTEVGNKRKASESMQESLLKSTVGWVGKNLLQNTASSRTVNGVTVTVNSDGSITLNGTHTASSSDFQVRTHVEDIIANGMIISGVPSDASNIKLRIALNQSPWTDFAVDTGSGATISGYSSQTNVNCNLTLVGNGTVYNDVTIYPMIRKADISDDTYEPYHESVEEEIEQIYAGNEVLGAKNLLENFALSSYTTQGVTFTKNSDGSITVNGTNTGTSNASCLVSAQDSTALNKYIGKRLKMTGGKGNAHMFIAIRHTDSTPTDMYQQSGNAIEFVIPSNIRNMGCSIHVVGGATVNNETVYPMLCLASDPDDTYVPYAMTNRELTVSKFDRAEQRVLGAKNLLPNNAISQTINGITFTVNADGSVTVNGAATALAWKSIGSIKLPVGKYILNGCPSGGDTGPATYCVALWNTDGGTAGSIINVRDAGDGVIVDITQELTYLVSIGIANGQTVNNLTFYPMLRLASDPDDTYVPYAMTNRELTEELLTGHESICTVTNGTATYNKVTKIGKLVSLDLSVSDVTLGAWTTLATLQETFRPRSTIRVLIFETANNNYHVGVIPHGGAIQCIDALTSASVTIHATWITD